MKRSKHISTYRKIALLFVLLNMFAFYSKAQQDPVYSQYINNLMSVNPAYTGLRGVGTLSNINRAQWIELEGAPMNSSITYAQPLDSLHTGVGLDFTYENIGPDITYSIFFNYSYRIQTTQNTQLSFGLKGGMGYKTANLIVLDRYHYDDPYILQYGDIDGLLLPNVGIGAFWYSSDFYLGFAIPRLIRNKYIRDKTSIETASREELHYMIHAAYMHRINDQFVFKPGISTIMTAGAPVTADFDFGFMYNNKIWMGARYRISEAAGAYVHMQVQENLKIGFLYEYPLNDLREHNIGTMELMLRFDFKTRDTQIFPDFSF